MTHEHRQFSQSILHIKSLFFPIVVSSLQKMLILSSAFVLLFAHVNGDTIEEADIPLDKGVMVLGQETFQNVIDTNRLVLVDFYAPW